MELRLAIAILFCVAYSFVADGLENDLDVKLESPVSEEVKQYIVKIVSMMTSKHSTDIQVLKDKIDILESEKEAYTYTMQDLEKKIVTVENEMKARSCQCDKKPDEQKYDDKTFTKDPSESENGQHTNQVIEKESPKYNQRRIQRASVESKVAFFATVTPQINHLGQNQDIVFDHIVTNIGGAYNEHHGTFVAPVSGTYVFSVTLLTGSSNHTWGHVMVNQAVVAKLIVYEGQASQTIVVNLQAGDDVSIQNSATDKAIHGDRYSGFSGFLLYEDISVGEIVG